MIFIALAVFVVLNMLIAIISEAYDTAVEKMRNKVKCNLTYELKLFIVEILLFKMPRGKEIMRAGLPVLKHLLPLRPHRNKAVSGFKSRRRSVTGGSPHTPALKAAARTIGILGASQRAAQARDSARQRQSPSPTGGQRKASGGGRSVAAVVPLNDVKGW